MDIGVSCLPEQNTGLFILYQEVCDEYLDQLVRRMFYTFSVTSFSDRIYIHSNVLKVLAFRNPDSCSNDSHSMFVKELGLLRIRTHELEQLVQDQAKC